MPRITYVSSDGITLVCEVPCGLSVMRGAVECNLPGISADCGGACACATCQVVVDQAWLEKVPGPQSMELSMLEESEEDSGMRRLSCQITVTNELDGLIVHVPKELY